jgi:hypothetical protein
LEHYDFILGMDWLKEFSPMKVHWKSKWLSIPYQGSIVLLQGWVPSDPDVLMVHVCLTASDQQGNSDTSVMPSEIAPLLSEFEAVFALVVGMPPPRACDHSIPLVAGAKSVFITPYRYPPALEDEIEKQIQEMLDKGIIRPSGSPFSSPLILVKKKDSSWRPCVDYRHTNALTIKG